jgi:aryl-alcohol dehydrogenase-like predicted oxidoreductase
MALAYLNRVILGAWQLAQGHGHNVERAEDVFAGYLEAGFRHFDMADIYTGVEERMGAVLRTHRPTGVRVHTKLVPDLSALPHFSSDDVRRSVDRSRVRLGVETLDLVQFHWWDLSVPGYLQVLETLQQLRAEGAIQALGVTNFATAQLREIRDSGIRLDSVQVQASLLDRRSTGAFSELLAELGVDLLAYGSVAGGLLGSHYLAAAAPSMDALENRSLAKYLLIVEEVGGWAALQHLLAALAAVAERHHSDLSSVASAYPLHALGAKATIVGIRSLRHLAAHQQLRDSLHLDPSDLSELERVRRRFPEVPGEVYELERDREGRHGRVMKYGLQEGAS